MYTGDADRQAAVIRVDVDADHHLERSELRALAATRPDLYESLIAFCAGAAMPAEAPRKTRCDDKGVSAVFLDPWRTEQQVTVTRVVTEGSRQFKACYEQALKGEPTLAGRVDVEWKLREGGVTSVIVYNNTTDDDDLAACMIGKISRWTGFPAELDGEVRWPFVFEPQG